MMKGELLFKYIENGRLYLPLQILVLAILALSLTQGLWRGDEVTRTRIYENQSKPLDTRYVSELPQQAEEESQAIDEGEENQLTPEDIRHRYVAYVVSTVRSNKVYPPEEQRRNHEGSVRMTITVMPDGRIKTLKLHQQARYMKLTQAAVQAVKKSNPLRAFPRGMNEDPLNITMEILFTLQ